MLGVNSVSVVCPAILGKRDFVIHPHGVNLLAVSGTLAEIGPACSGYPVTCLGHLNNVASLAPVLALRQCTATAEWVGSKPQIMVNDVGVESGHSGSLRRYVVDAAMTAVAWSGTDGKVAAMLRNEPPERRLLT